MIASTVMDTSLVAVLGGGQLGRMLALAGIPMGLRFRFLDPSPDAASRGLGDLVTADLGDPTAIAATADSAAVVTYEWEGVPGDAVTAAALGVPVLPPVPALEVSQDRLAEKELFTRLGIATAPFAAVDDRAGLEAAVAAIGLPAVLKTRRGGYDGKGQRVLRTPTDLTQARDDLGDAPLILEGHVAFDRELSVLAARGRDGETRCWPLVENHHDDGILRVSIAPAPDVDEALQATGATIATAVLDELDYVGVLAVELFEHRGALLANELAPRVHNSGHWTIEGSRTSQFEQHLRAILGWPLGSCAMQGACAMVNCLGTVPARASVLAIEGAHLHDYAKVPRPGRKVGHITVVADTPEARDDALQQLQTVLHT